MSPMARNFSPADWRSLEKAWLHRSLSLTRRPLPILFLKSHLRALAFEEDVFPIMPNDMMRTSKWQAELEIQPLSPLQRFKRQGVSSKQPADLRMAFPPPHRRFDSA